jgi:hypothetical protein
MNADIVGMRETPHVIDDLPPFIVERRRSPDRRTVWRGGRRDSDWINRPPGALDRMQRPAGIWQFLRFSRQEPHANT